MNTNQEDFFELVCPRCGARHLLRRTNPAASTIFEGKRGNGVEPVPFSYFYPQASIEVFSMLILNCWSINGGVDWVPYRPAAPTNISLRFANPDGVTTFDPNNGANIELPAG